MWKRAIGVCLALWICAGSAFSQTRTSMRIAVPPAHQSDSHRGFAHPFFGGFPYWTDYASPNETAPSVIVVQAPAPPVQGSTPKSDEAKSSSAPLMIEWQGDRYVRRTTLTGNSRADQPDYIAEAAPSARDRQKVATSRMEPWRALGPLVSSPKPAGHSIDSSKQSEPPPTTFVFRDGHQEQSSDYSIISGVIYARGDYWNTGHWSKQIRVSELDLPATMKANQNQGASFRLPTAPNEVITRP
jgi:hypothetical protein